MRFIRLTQGKFATVEDRDYAELVQYNWCARKDRNTFYAVRSVYVSAYKQKTVRMHREILELGDRTKVDHRDGNGLNNLRENLRVASTTQNGQNRRKVATASSKFKGVSWHARDKRWQVRIEHDGRRIQLGYFRSEVEAAKAYDWAARVAFGKFAKTNL